MTFDHLSDGQFEECVYDVLVGLGFVNVSWRRGSGTGGPSADQGRDLVADLVIRDVDGSASIERWFVQCKHYQRGVPPEALQGTLTWATAERPQVVAFAISNALSNPAKNWIAAYEENNRPAFRIKVWERKELERLILSSPTIAAKYGLLKEGPGGDMHPAHLRYVVDPFFNSLDFFFQAVDTLDPHLRDLVFDFAFHSVISPRFREPVTGDEKLADLMLDTVDFASFRRQCYQLRQHGLAEHFLVQSIMLQTLAWARRFGDGSQVSAIIGNYQDAGAYCTKQLKNERDEKRQATLQRMIASGEAAILEAPQRQRDAAVRYVIVCESLLPRLALEPSI